jgi:hypothetical protein
MQVNCQIYFCFTLRVIFLVEWFCFPLPPQVGFVLHQGVNLVLFYTTVFSILFYTNPIFPPCFTLWVKPPCFTLWGRGRPCPFVPVLGLAWHGMATLLPTKAKNGIFKPVAGRYIFFSGVT